MPCRYLSIWFKYLKTDWLALKKPQLAHIPFVFTTTDRGRLIVAAVNRLAAQQGVRKDMPLIDARSLITDLQAFDDDAARGPKLLGALADWCTRYSPIVAPDPPDGLLLDITGCAHLWKGEHAYFREIVTRLQNAGYTVRGAIADTIGTAWAIARYGEKGKTSPIIEPSRQSEALALLHPSALRLSVETLEALHNLGMYHIADFAGMPKNALYRRFKKELVHQLEKALGTREEQLTPLETPVPYHQRLACLSPIVSAGGIEIALQQLLDKLCRRLQQEGMGLRKAIFRTHRVDNHIQDLDVGTTRPSNNPAHLLGLFKEKIGTLEPGLGIELFTLDAPVVAPARPGQQLLWGGPAGLEDGAIAEWMDRIIGRLGASSIHRFLPDQHHWPERSQKPAGAVDEQPAISWSRRQSRPIRLLRHPAPIQVTAPIPDYPPMNFRYRGQLHELRKAAGPERIEREWWLDPGEHRDYYWVENTQGKRYWIFRSGHYQRNTPAQWFLHGFFG